MIPLFKVSMAPSEILDNKLCEVLHSGYVGQGQKVEQFESLLNKRFRTRWALTTNSATSGLHLAAHMIRTPGKNLQANVILSSPLTCTATNWPVISNGYDIRWVDVDPVTLNMDLDDLERKLDTDVAGIVVVHWGGYPVDLDKLNSILARFYSVTDCQPVVIEDCAHSFGSEYRLSNVGNYPYSFNRSFGVYSFQAIKHFTTVDGGMIISSNKIDYDRTKLLRWYGIDRDGDRKDFRCESDVPEVGYKFHMNDVNATIGIANLEIIDYVLSSHRSNASFYNYTLQNVDGVKLTQPKINGFRSSYWLYTIYVDDRDNFMQAMNSRGIMVSRVHERNDIHTAVAKYRTQLTMLDEVASKMICIPVGWWITDESRQYIVDSIKMGW